MNNDEHGGHVGKSFVLDYGDFAVKVHYLSDHCLRWEQLKGPAPGSCADESYESTEIRPGIVFFSWQEKDTSIVSQVIDFERSKVSTIWISPEKQLLRFNGTVEPAPSHS